MPDIASLGWFTFLLLIVCTGYIFIENLGGYYRFRKSLNRQGSLERVLHYIIWGIVINLFFDFLLSNIPPLADYIGAIFNQSGSVANSVNVMWNTASIQLFLFSLGYRIVLIALTLVITWVIKYIIDYSSQKK